MAGRLGKIFAVRLFDIILTPFQRPRVKQKGQKWRLDVTLEIHKAFDDISKIAFDCP